MKKRVVALLLCVVSCLLLMPASGATGVYFVAVDDSYILEVTDETMPFWDGGYLYVDSRVFKGLSLPQGTLYHTHNTSKGVLALYVTESVRSLVFNLVDNTTQDNGGNFYHRGAIQKGDVVFLPIALVANYFDLRYTVSQVAYGTLVRLTVEQDPVLSDRAFADAALDQVRARYQEYVKSQTPETDTSPTPPPTTPGSSAVEPEVPQGKDLYLTIRVADADVLTQWISLLDSAAQGATFFFDAQALLDSDSGDALRQLRGKGYGVGLVVDGALKDDLDSQLTAGQAALFQATTTTTRMVTIDNPKEGDVTLAQELGYAILAPTVSSSESPLVSATLASQLMAKVDDADPGVIVWLDAGTTSSGLSAFLSYLQRAEDVSLVLNEWVISMA